MVRFLEEVLAGKFAFEIYWPLVRSAEYKTFALKSTQYKFWYRGWVPKFATGIYIFIKDAFIFNFLTRLVYKKEN